MGMALFCFRFFFFSFACFTASVLHGGRTDRQTDRQRLDYARGWLMLRLPSISAALLSRSELDITSLCNYSLCSAESQCPAQAQAQAPSLISSLPRPSVPQHTTAEALTCAVRSTTSTAGKGRYSSEASSLDLYTYLSSHVICSNRPACQTSKGASPSSSSSSSDISPPAPAPDTLPPLELLFHMLAELR